MGCLISCVSCCFCNAAASLCCKCLPSCKNSTSTRLSYGLILLVVLVLSCICLSPGVEKLLKKIPYLCSDESDNICNLIIGYGAVYRMCLAISLFFCFFAIIMIKVKTSTDFRAAVHNGFWFFKVLAIIGIMIGVFFIRGSQFLNVWRIFGLIGAILFILLQLIILIDLAYSWNQTLLDGFEESGNKAFACGLIFSTFVFYALTLTGIVLLYVYFASAAPCQLGKMLVSINLILCFTFSIVSIMPKIQENLPNSGLLQSSVISAYIVFLTWSALADIPDVKCNPALSTVNITVTDENNISTVVAAPNLTFNWQTGVSLAITLISVAFACIRSSSNNYIGRLTIAGDVDTSNAAEYGGENKAEHGQTVWDNEKDGVAYSYAMFHFMMLLAALFVMMSITNWYSPDQRTGLLSANLSSFWIKAVTSWVCAALYAWTLVAPSLFPDRDFT